MREIQESCRLTGLEVCCCRFSWLVRRRYAIMLCNGRVAPPNVDGVMIDMV